MAFNYQKTDYNYIAYYRNGHWWKGRLRKSHFLSISAFSPCLHYGQEAFEGLKAYRSKDDRILLFRPEENSKRLNASARRLMMPEVPYDMFFDAIKRVVLANEKHIPNYDSKGSLYIRPYLIGVGDNLGVKPAKEYIFGVLCSPVGAYFSKDFEAQKFIITEYDRAAPHGVGHIKTGGNYAASLFPHQLAVEQGYSDCIYLDPKTHTKIDEVGSANFIGIRKDGVLVTPKSSSILPSITKDSIIRIARDIFHLQVIEGDIFVEDLSDFVEAGACGTAAVITPISSIKYGEKEYTFSKVESDKSMLRKLYETLVNIQYGNAEYIDFTVHINNVQ